MALALPAAVLLLIFIIGLVNGILQGFGIMPFLGMTEPTLQYYEQVFARSDLASSLSFSLYLACVSTIIAVVGGIALSAALTRIKASRFVRLLDLHLPILTMHSLVALAVVCLFAGSGIFPRLLNVVGVIGGPNEFASVVGAPNAWGAILVYAWKEIPYIAFCTIAVMGGVSSSYGEAAATLGASALRSFFTVVLPLCRSVIAKASLVVFAFAFGSYEVPFLLGPTLPKAMPVLAYIEFQNPDIVNRCYAMALNGTMTLICSLLVVAYFIVLHREKKAGDQK